MLVDGSNLVMRCVKAMEYSGLRGGEDWSTGPLTAFIGSLTRFVRLVKPIHLVVCWDAGPCERRTSIYPEYKASRKEPSPESAERKDTAFGMVKNFLTHMKVQQVAVQGFEADDVVAAYWGLGLPEIAIVSGDKDFLQLVGDGTVLLRPDVGGIVQTWGPEQVRDKYGCEPHQLPLLWALTGDASDGVPGVRGIGPKRALSGLQRADWSLQGVEALKDPARRCDAELSHELVDLRNPSHHPDVPPLREFKPLRANNLQESYDAVVFLRSLGLDTVLNKFYTNTLWG